MQAFFIEASDHLLNLLPFLFHPPFPIQNGRATEHGNPPEPQIHKVRNQRVGGAIKCEAGTGSRAKGRRRRVSREAFRRTQQQRKETRNLIARASVSKERAESWSWLRGWASRRPGAATRGHNPGSRREGSREVGRACVRACDRAGDERSHRPPPSSMRTDERANERANARADETSKTR